MIRRFSADNVGIGEGTDFIRDFFFAAGMRDKTRIKAANHAPFH